MKSEQFWKLDIETLRWLHEQNLITATAYVLGIIRGTRKQGWKWAFNASDFCQEWGVSERSFYRAISFLKTHNLIEWKVKGEITVWWNENASNLSVVSVLPSVAEPLPSVAEPLPSVAEPLPSVAEPLPSVAEETLESLASQSFQEFPTLYSDIFYRSDSLNSLSDIAPAVAAPISHPSEEREKEFGFQIRKEEETPQSLTTLPDQPELQLTSKSVVETIVPAPAEIAIKYDPALGIRPPRQKPKFRYPDGPWLTQSGQINEDFIRDRAALWRTGDTTASKGFGAMAIEDVIGLVCGHYQRTENHAKLETDWTAYVAKNQRYVSNVQMRVAAGIEIKPDEQSKILQKVPALMSEKIEPAYGNAITDSLIKSEPLQLESVATVPDEIWDTIATATEEEQAQFSVPIPEGADNVAAYINTAKPEDSDYFRALHEKHQNGIQLIVQPAQRSLEELKSRIDTFISNKAMPSVSADARARMRDEERLGRKLAHWTALLDTGISSVIADVHRQASAQGYEIIDGQISEVDF